MGDRTGHAITKSLRDAFESGSGTLFANSPLSAIEPGDHGWRATCGEHELDAATVVLAAGGRCFKIAQERGELSTNHPNATGEVTRMALALGARRATSTSSSTTQRGAWPETMQGYSIPETTRAYGAVLLNADGEEFTDSLGPRDVVSQAIFDEVEKGKGVETEDGRPPSTSTRRGSRRTTPRSPSRMLASTAARASTRSSSRSSRTPCSTTRTAA